MLYGVQCCQLADHPFRNTALCNIGKGATNFLNCRKFLRILEPKECHEGSLYCRHSCGLTCWCLPQTQLWSDLLVLTGDTQLWSQLLVLTADTQLWSDLLVLTADTQLWSQLLVLTADTQMWSHLMCFLIGSCEHMHNFLRNMK